MIHEEIRSHARTGMAQKLIRLRNPATGLYLHLSGEGETRGTDWAWSGTHAQATRLRLQHLADGKRFPWRIAAMRPPRPAVEPDRYGNPTPPRPPLTARAPSSSHGAD